jgi:Outer membrane protein beta-barrel domain
MLYQEWPAIGRSLAVGAVLLLASASVHAQLSSQGHGQLAFMLGQGSGPFSGLASDVVNQNHDAPEGTLKHSGFRITGGYQFADFFSAEAGITHLGPFRSRAPYLSGDEVIAEASLVALEADLVGRLPFAPNFRLDLTLGAVTDRLETQLSTAYGSALPVGQRTTVDSHHFGITLGADLEWRVTEITSLIIGYHAYPDVGTNTLIGSAKGTLSLVAAGVHFEF